MEPKILDVVALIRRSPEHPVMPTSRDCSRELCARSTHSAVGGLPSHRPAEKIFPSTSTKLPLARLPVTHRIFLIFKLLVAE